MNVKARTTATALLIVCCACAAWAQTPQKRAITFKDLISMHRVSDPQISPDGEWIAYSVATPDLDANKSVRNIWLVRATGGESRQLTRSGTDERPRWSPDGKVIAFISSRSGTPQVYMIDLEGGEANRITSLSTGADNQLWSPDGKAIAFISSVYPDCKDDDCNKKRDEEAEKSKVKAHIAEHLLYRHWNSWSDGKRSHLFVVAAAGGGTPRDLTAGANYDVPPFNLGEPDAIAFSPDSQELAFTANPDKDAGLSTNGDIFTVPAGGSSEPKRITTNPANDWGPQYSADGKWIAYRAQAKPGYESDRWRLTLYERATGLHKNLTEQFDDNVDEFVWSPDSSKIYFVSARKAENPVYSIAIDSNSSPKDVIATGANGELGVSRDGHRLIFTRSAPTMPAEVFDADSDGSNVQQVSHQNESLLAQLNLSTVEPFWFAGADKTQVQALLLRPPDFDPSKKYPLLLLVHGGPQGEWGNNWGGYRWNAQVMAAPGYVVLMINPRGSFGYGSKFTEEISRDWGGKVYTDLINGVDAAIAKYPFIDGSRTCAAGGSYGGYMIDWIATHTGRFNCLISHAGPYDAVAMYATEELWFNEWEFGGPPWVSPEIYKKWSPSEYAANLGKYKTPTLVIGGELDFRVPYTQDLEFFSALQRQGVPSKLMIFPDEGHWVLKPQNSQLWYKTFLDWLAKYLR